MINNTLFPFLSIILLATGLPAFPSQGAQGAVEVGSCPRPVVNIPQAPDNSEMTQLSLQRRNARYRLSEGDILDLDFRFTPEFNQTVTVLPDGFISLRGVGSLHVQGETLPELRRSLQEVYSKSLHEPIISIVLKDFEKPYFIVGGQVQHPGKFDLRGDTTVLQAVEIAGGFNDNAKHAQVLLFHRVSNGWVEVKKLNLKGVLRGRDLGEDPHLKPGDMLFVPKSAASKIKQFIPSTGMGVYYNPTQY